MNNETKKKQISKSRKVRYDYLYSPNIIMIIVDALIILWSYFSALLLRFDFRIKYIPDIYLYNLIKIAPISILLSILIYYLTQNYRTLLKYASYFEFKNITIATLLSFIINYIIYKIMGANQPRSFFVLGASLQYFLILASRFGVRYLMQALSRRNKLHSNLKVKRTLIIGAGKAARATIDDLNRNSKSRYLIVCAIDDNSSKHNKLISGIPIVGGRDDILKAAQDYNIDTIIFAIPSLDSINKRDILHIAKETGCELKTLPSADEIVSGKVSMSNINNVKIEDLLGRQTIQILDIEDFDYIKNKTILVTGGGGSIGSELCRQIASHNPKKLIIFDIYENNAYEIEQELKRSYPNLDLVTLIGSVRDSLRLMSIFDEYMPEIVFHAAAHKHVPLMETSPAEAIKNNVLGTYKVAYSALVHNVERFILISTDKAVNPTNIMGASKRMCEMIIQTMDKVCREKDISYLPKLYARFYLDNNKKTKKINFNTDFVAVRFGNVLGSNGSVIPLFKKQIEEGGPITVTHPDIIRYFMTISEAVSLVLQAGNLARGGEIFVLDMGAPVKIDDLARNLIKLSGLEPNVDIDIKYSGLRPGEKLYEEKLMAEEGLEKTKNELIHIGKPIEFDSREFFNQLEKLEEYCYENSKDIINLVSNVVDTYHSPESDIEISEEKIKELYQNS